MQASELRIGNLVDFVNRTNPLHRPLYTPLIVMEVTQIDIKCYPYDQSLHKVLRYNSLWLADVEPIPITDEWLVRFGFERIGNPNHTPNWIWVKDGNRWVYQKFKDGSFKLIPYKLTGTPSIHQLQNLYFALTGTELTLKPC
jgi:hypothetical protein